MLREAIVIGLDDSDKFESAKADEPAPGFCATRQCIPRIRPGREDHRDTRRFILWSKCKEDEQPKTENRGRYNERRVEPPYVSF